MTRWVVGFGAIVAAGLAGDANASVSIAVTWEGLVSQSSAVAVLTAVESHGAWENGRIFTYTRLHVDRAVEGDMATGGEVLVRTLGGVVGEIGQRVEGEAAFDVGKPCLVFAHPGPPGAYVVTARGQGAFPVVPGAEPQAPPRVTKGASLGGLIPPAAVGAKPRLAVEMVPGRLVDDVARDVASDWTRLHAAPAR